MSTLMDQFFYGGLVMQTAEPQQETVYVTPKKKPVYEFFKRFFDLTLSLIAMIPFALIYVCVAIAVKIEDGGPVIYSSVRYTKGGKAFKMYKFRSMCTGAEQMEGGVYCTKGDKRVTKVGKFIRATSIDELPQLINILKGDMTIVGPRPERPEIAAQYEEVLPSFRLRLQVKAGLTGTAQIYGKYNTSAYDKLRLDLKSA